MDTVPTTDASATDPSVGGRAGLNPWEVALTPCETAGCEHKGFGHYLDETDTPLHRAVQTVADDSERPLWRISFEKWGSDPWAIALWVSDDTLTPKSSDQLMRVLKHVDRLLGNLEAGRDLNARQAVQTPAQAAAERRGRPMV